VDQTLPLDDRRQEPLQNNTTDNELAAALGRCCFGLIEYIATALEQDLDNRFVRPFDSDMDLKGSALSTGPTAGTARFE